MGKCKIRGDSPRICNKKKRKGKMKKMKNYLSILYRPIVNKKSV